MIAPNTCSKYDCSKYLLKIQLLKILAQNMIAPGSISLGSHPPFRVCSVRHERHYSGPRPFTEMLNTILKMTRDLKGSHFLLNVHFWPLPHSKFRTSKGKKQRLLEAVYEYTLVSFYKQNSIFQFKGAFYGNKFPKRRYLVQKAA